MLAYKDLTRRRGSASSAACRAALGSSGPTGDGDAIGLLVATALPARDHATIVPFDPSCHRAAVSPWADGDAAWADADGDVAITSAAAPVRTSACAVLKFWALAGTVPTSSGDV